MKCHCPPDPAGEPGPDTVVDHVRLFPNVPELRWQYRVHEQIMPSLRRNGTRVQWADVTIRHVGYQEPGLRRAKLERDIRLLERSLAQEGEEPFVLFNLASVFVEQGRFAEALPLLKKSLARSHPTDSIVRKLYALFVQCLRRLEQPAAALESCRAGREIYPEDAELLFQQGLILRGMGDWKGAEACLLRLLQSREGDHFASVDPGLRGYKARHNLAVLYQDQGRLEEAKAQWRAVTAERPDFIPAWLGLGELYLAANLWHDLDAVMRHCSRHRKEGTKRHCSAPEPCSNGRNSRPREPRSRNPSPGTRVRSKPRVILSHVLLQEGRDPRAALAALQAILRSNRVIPRQRTIWRYCCRK